VRNIQSFLRFYNFYRKFIRNYNRISKLLFRLIKKKIIFVFNENCRKVFAKLKKRLLIIFILTYYDLYREIRLKTDASNKIIIKIFL